MRGQKGSPVFDNTAGAAELAAAGDRVIVHEGEYREWVRPKNGGLSEDCRIIYEAAEGEHVTIKGSERITGWENIEGTIWKVSVPNEMFGGFNPYETEIFGDWDRCTVINIRAHAGDADLNGRSFLSMRQEI